MDLIVPRDVEMACQLTPRPYVVRRLAWDDFQKLDNLYISGIRPGNVPGDERVHDLSALIIKPDGIGYKTHFSETEFTRLPRRIDLHTPKHFVPMFTERRRIKARKYKDLQSLKESVIPRDHHAFFDQLPHK